MGLKDIYFGVEDKYYAFLEWMEAKHIPIFGLVDKVEAAGVPTFPIFILLILVLIIGIFTAIGGGLGIGGSATVNVAVLDAGNNPIEGVLVKASFGGTERTAVSDADGKAIFQDVPLNSKVGVQIDSTKYQASPASFSATSSVNNQTIIAEEIKTTKSISIQLVKDGGQELIQKNIAVEFSCSNNSDFHSSQTSITGEIQLEVPLNCGTLYASPKSDTIAQSGQIAVDIEAAQPSISLSETAQRKGHVRVEVKDSDGNPIQNIQLSLKSQYGDPISTAISDASGIGEFSDVPADKYFISGYDSTGNFQYKESSLQQVAADDTTVFALAMSKGIVGEIRVKIVDSSNNSAVANATVLLMKDNSIITTKTTDTDGKIAFPVSSNLLFKVSIDHPDYLKKVQDVKVDSTGAYTNIPLVRATPTNSQAVSVSVKDEFGSPIESARVTLKKSPSGSAVGTAKLTGVDGLAAFTSLEEGDYFVSASKPGFTLESHSNVFSVKAREATTVELKLSIGQGNLAVKVLDSEGNPLSGASVKTINAFTGEEIGAEAATGLDGSATVSARADQKIVLVVSEPSHLPFTSIPVQMQKDVTQQLSIQMVKEIKKLEIQIEGVFQSGEALSSDSSLTPGALYTIKALYLVPKNSGYTEGGIHLRTGQGDEGKTNLMENDSWFIKEIRAASSTIQKGKSYSPSQGYSTDAAALTQSDAKWANVIFKNPGEGAYEIEADLQVRDSAVIGSSLPLFYRAYGKAGGTIRFPVDNALGSTDSSADKQALYANANSKIYSVGPNSSLCSGNFCVALSVEAQGIQTAVSNEFDTGVSNTHTLAFTITNTSSSVFNDATLTLSTSGSGLQMGQYDVTSASGQKKTGKVTGSKQDLSVGGIQPDGVVFGTANFEAVRDGTSKIILQIVSDKKEAMKKELIVKVDAANEVSATLLPKVIVPFIVNHLLMSVQQNQNGSPIGIEDASVNVYLNDTLLTGGTTNFDGTFAFDLSAPETGDKVKIVIQKPGIRTIEKDIMVNEDILLAVPEKLAETLVLNQAVEKTKAVKIFNTTSIPLTIKDIKLNANVEGLVDFQLSDELIGKTLEVNEDTNVFFSLKLTEKGQQILSPRQLTGAVNIVLENSEIGKIWSANIPLQINLAFGGNVDTENCLVADQTQWNLFSAKEEKTLTVNLLNKCTVAGAPVNLRNLQARVKLLSDNELGKFSATTSEVKQELGPGFQKIQEIVPSDSEAVVSLSFTPGAVKSGETDAIIIFEAVNPTAGGQQDKLDQELKVKIKLNDLSACVNVKTPQSLVIEGCPINTGLGAYQGYYGRGNSPYYNPTGFNQQFQGIGNPNQYSQRQGYPYGAGNSYANGVPNGYFQNPLVDRFNMNPISYSQSFCGQTEFRVENNCASDLEFDLGVDPNIQTSKNAFTLKPGDSDRISVESGYKIGKYPILVNAKVKGSTDASKEVSSLDFIIKSPTEINSDCISLDTEKYEFNDFIQKPVKGKAINSCYDQGVRIDDTGGSIKVTGSYNPQSGAPANGRPNNPAGSSLVRDIKTLGQFTQSGSNGTQQIVEFQIFPSLEKYSPSPDKLENGNAIQQTLDLRFLATKRYYIVESYATISVRYNDPYGQRREKPFEVIFEDLFNLPGIIDEISTLGSSKITNYQDCINPNALTKTASGSAIVFGETEFTGGTTADYAPIPSNQVLKIDEKFCGSQDKLKNLQASSVTQDGVRVDFSIAGSEHNVQAHIVRPSGLSKDITIKGTLKAELVRPFSAGFSIGNQAVDIPYELVIKKPANPQEIAFTPTACEAEGFVTAPGAYKQYGFDKIQFDWKWNSIGKNACDASNANSIFCDATQFSIELNRKVNQLNDFFKEASKQPSAKLAGNVEINTKTIFGHAFDTIQLHENYDSEGNPVDVLHIAHDADGNPIPGAYTVQIPTYTYFKAINPGILLSSAPLPFTFNISIDTGTSGITEDDEAKALHEFLNEFSKLPDKENHSYMMKIYTVGWNADDLKILTDFGGELIASDTYVLTMNEFSALINTPTSTAAEETPFADDTARFAFNAKILGDDHSELIRAVVYNEADGLNAQDLSDLLNSLKKGSKNPIVPAISTAYTTAKYTGGFPEVLADLAFTSQLMKDGYSDQFIADFTGVDQKADGYPYKDNSTLFDNFTFDPLSLSAPGIYPVQIGLSLVNGEVKSTNVTINQDADKSITLAQLDKTNSTKYSENPLFELPFDGITKSAAGIAGTRTRKGYGVGLVGEKDIVLKDDVKLGNVSPETGKPNLITSYQTTFSEINQTPRSPILVLNDTKLQFAPSIPVPLKAKITAGAQGLLQYGIAQNLSNPRADEISNSHLLTWTNCVSGNNVFDQKGGICSPARDATDYTLVTPGNDNFEFSSIAYVPQAENDIFGLFCAADGGKVFSPAKPTGMIIEEGKNNSFALQNSKIPLSAVPKSVDDALKLIKESESCIKIQDKSIEVIWNTANDKVIPKEFTCQLPAKK